jgi:bacteriorhodopsin
MPSTAVEKTSMAVTFLALAGVGVITLLESIRSPDLTFVVKKDSDGAKSIKRDQLLLTALQVETVVNIIAAFVYMIMLKSEKSKVMSLRYADWAFTTPMLLFSLTLYLCHLNQRQGIDKQKPDLFLGIAILLNFIMISSGYFAEKMQPSTKKYLLIALGFGALVGVFFTIGVAYLNWGNEENNGADERDERRALFSVIAVVWVLYGVGACLKSDVWKNTLYNTLDLIAKVFFGFFLYLQIRLVAPAMAPAVADQQYMP